jgi:putative ABC transport system substrate-binding protein
LPELAKRGFVEGQNLNIEARFGEPSRIPELSKDLVQTQPDVVVAVSSPVIRMLASAGPNVPVVAAFFGSDPVAEGMAVSLGKPGGRITGIAMLSETLDAKRLDLLSETLPELRRVAVLAGRPPRHDANVAAMQEAAQRLRLELTVFEADTPDEYPAAFERMRAQRAQALVIASAPDFYRDAAVLAKAATNVGLPTICEWREMAESGCLLAYGPINADLTRRIAAYIVQILRGVPPGELPIEAPTRFDFTLNLKTAASLGLRLPPAALIRADEVVE